MNVRLGTRRLKVTASQALGPPESNWAFSNSIPISIGGNWFCAILPFDFVVIVNGYPNYPAEIRNAFKRLGA